MIPLISIFAKEIFKLFFLFHIKDYSGNVIAITTWWLGFQIIGSVIFGYISDKNLRKVILLITLTSSIGSILFLHYNLFWIAIIIDGFLCNITPVARAAYCDHHPKRNRRILMTNTFLAQSLPWIIIGWSTKIVKEYLFQLSFMVSILSSFLILIFFTEIPKKGMQTLLQETKDLKKKYVNIVFVKTIIAFFLLEITYQIMPYFGEANFNLPDLQRTFLFLGLGITFGCLFHKVFQISNIYKTINLIILGAFVLYFFEWLSAALTAGPFNVSVNIYLLFAFFGGLYWPLIYAYFSEKAKIHEEGLIFGVLDSIQSFAELVPPLVLIWMKTEKLSYAPFLVLLGIAFMLTFKMEYLAFYKKKMKGGRKL